MITSTGLRSRHAWVPLVRPLGLLVVWDVGVTVTYLNDSTHFESVDVQLTLFGSAIALFVGFMVNAAYGRWWEARTLWGQIVNSSRSLARQALVLIDEPAGRADGRGARIVRAQIAYVHLLRTSLRGQESPPEAAAYLSPEVLARVEGAKNKPTAVLAAIGEAVADAARDGEIGDISKVQIESTLVALTDAQGGAERINNTPMPMQYRFFPGFFARLFCLLLPFAVVDDLGWATPIGSGLVSLMFLLAVKVGGDLADPFEDRPHDVPLTALCRTIEIDLTEMLGVDPPEKVTPVGRVLW